MNETSADQSWEYDVCSVGRSGRRRRFTNVLHSVNRRLMPRLRRGWSISRLSVCMKRVDTRKQHRGAVFQSAIAIDFWRFVDRSIRPTDDILFADSFLRKLQGVSVGRPTERRPGGASLGRSVGLYARGSHISPIESSRAGQGRRPGRASARDEGIV